MVGLCTWHKHCDVCMVLGMSMWDVIGIGTCSLGDCFRCRWSRLLCCILVLPGSSIVDRIEWLSCVILGIFQCCMWTKGIMLMHSWLCDNHPWSCWVGGCSKWPSSIVVCPSPLVVTHCDPWWVHWAVEMIWCGMLTKYPPCVESIFC